MVGGVLNLIDWFFIYLAAAFQNWSFDNNLIERLYSTNQNFNDKGELLPEEEEETSTQDKDITSKIKHKLKQRKQLKSTYCSYLLITRSSCFMCCGRCKRD
jgi:hypothetical protein